MNMDNGHRKVAAVETPNGWTVDIALPTDEWIDEKLSESVDIGAKQKQYKYGSFTHKGWESPDEWDRSDVEDAISGELEAIEAIFEKTTPGGIQADFEALFSTDRFFPALWDSMTSGDYAPMRKLLRPFYSASDVDAIVQEMAGTPNFVRKVQESLIYAAMHQAFMTVYGYDYPQGSGDVSYWDSDESALRNSAENDLSAVAHGYDIYQAKATLDDFLRYNVGNRLDTFGDKVIDSVDARPDPETLIREGMTESVIALSEKAYNAPFMTLTIYRTRYQAKRQGTDEVENLGLLERIEALEKVLDLLEGYYGAALISHDDGNSWSYTGVEWLRMELKKAVEKEKSGPDQTQLGLPGIGQDTNIRITKSPRAGDYIVEDDGSGKNAFTAYRFNPDTREYDLLVEDDIWDEAIEAVVADMQQNGLNPQDQANRIWLRQNDQYTRIQAPVGAGTDPWPLKPAENVVPQGYDLPENIAELLAEARVNGLPTRTVNMYLKRMTEEQRNEYDRLLTEMTLGSSYQPKSDPLAKPRTAPRRGPAPWAYEQSQQDIAFPKSVRMPMRERNPDEPWAGAGAEKLPTKTSGKAKTASKASDKTTRKTGGTARKTDGKTTRKTGGLRVSLANRRRNAASTAKRA